MKVLNEGVMEEMLKRENMLAAWQAVKTNHGAAGIDGISIEEFPAHIGPHWETIRAKVLDGRYKPAPVRRVYIPKDNGRKRPLGIPCVLDRLLQQAMLQVLQPQFEPLFSEHSFGFRPGRSAHGAVKAAQGYIAEGKDWVVDMDLKSFFDEENHDILMSRAAQMVQDKRMLKLIGRFLRAGVYEDGTVTKQARGAPQGGPHSPLLSNIYFDALDKELELRGQSFCRYAGDCNIYTGSRKAAERVFKSATAWIEKHLKAPVNYGKSDSGRPWERQFLGFQPTEDGALRPSPKSLKKLKDRVRESSAGTQAGAAHSCATNGSVSSEAGATISRQPTSRTGAIKSAAGYADTSANGTGCAGTASRAADATYSSSAPNPGKSSNVPCTEHRGPCPNTRL